ncbi:ribonuclease-like [Synchiropus splendidus]|uniref:ribonuclease-like n=1 Tax=Synchiropus splendidus TaxID=270530 RepID=UPI00237E449B|nr:ribonuclease-like [Synchiropus splendidus]
MSMKIFFALLLLPILCAGRQEIFKDKPIRPGPSLSFEDKHINPRMRPEQCTDVIQQRHIFKDCVKKTCRETQSFIRATMKDMKKICDRQKGPTTSKRKFSVVVCCLQGEKKEPCKYTAGKVRKQKIRVICKNGLPVHYASKDGDLCPPV